MAMNVSRSPTEAVHVYPFKVAGKSNWLGGNALGRIPWQSLSLDAVDTAVTSLIYNVEWN